MGQGPQDLVTLLDEVACAQPGHEGVAGAVAGTEALDPTASDGAAALAAVPL